MANFNENTQRKTGFFHALGYVLTKFSNDPFNEQYKSAHNVQTNEIWTDVINYSQTFTDAQNEANSNDAVQQIGNNSVQAVLYPLKDSDRQSWFLDTGNPTFDTNGYIPSDGWVKPLISPVDVTNEAGAPSNGFRFRLHQPDGTSISPLNGRWEVDYYSGLIKFQEGFTPSDSGNGLNFIFDAVAFQNSNDPDQFIEDNAPRAIAFGYRGQFLMDLLENLPSQGSSAQGSEWQDSVKSYLTVVGDDQIINSLTTIDTQIEYLNSEYNDYYIYITSGTNSYGLSGDSWYNWSGETFSSHTPSTADDDNRYLLVENSFELDVAEFNSGSQSYTLQENVVVPEDRILTYLDPSFTGLSQSAWEITTPRIGMVTTLDNIENNLIRYVGSSSGWVEYFFEQTFKVNSQKDLIANLTEIDYDVAVDTQLEFEPSGNKSVDILINGVEIAGMNYIFARPHSFINLTTFSVSGTNSITVDQSEEPDLDDYLRFEMNNGDFKWRKILSITQSGSDSIIEYSGENVIGIIDYIDSFSVTIRDERIAKKGDLLLWLGDDFYQLDQLDLLTFEYVSIDPDAQFD